MESLTGFSKLLQLQQFLKHEHNLNGKARSNNQGVKQSYHCECVIPRTEILPTLPCLWVNTSSVLLKLNYTVTWKYFFLYFERWDFMFVWFYHWFLEDENVEQSICRTKHVRMVAWKYRCRFWPVAVAAGEPMVHVLVSSNFSLTW